MQVPFGLLNLLDERCGVFEDIDAVIPQAEREEFMHRCHKMAAGLAERLNAAASIIPPGARCMRLKVSHVATLCFHPVSSRHSRGAC